MEIQDNATNREKEEEEEENVRKEETSEKADEDKKENENNCEQKQRWVDKYKPNRLEDFEMSENYIFVFRRLISQNQLNLLIVGKEGTGKSTLLKTLVKEYYFPFSLVDYKQNLMSMHALKEQSMQLFRKNEIKTFCQTRSVIEGKKKIMLLDDFDNMPEANQKYFLNIMERYQNNVNFVASCNNMQKVASVLQSRLLLIHLPILQPLQMKNILDKIILAEGHQITPDACEKLILTSRHQINLMIHFLEKIHLFLLSTGGPPEIITSQLVTEMTTIIDFETFDLYFEKLQSTENKLAESIKIIFDLMERGFSVIDVLDSLFQYVKGTTIPDPLKFEIIEVICKYTCYFYQIHEDDLELSLLTNEIFKIFHPSFK